jgi:hypothetical protein
MSLDQTSDSIEERRFLNRHMKELKDAEKDKEVSKHFNFDEITTIAIIYYKITKSENENKTMTSQSFSSILHTAFGMANDSLMDRILYGFKITSVVTLSAWIRALTLFLRGNLDQKIKYCFEVFIDVPLF